MSGINEGREKQIQELDSFIQMTKDRLNNVLSRVGWTLESVSNESQNTVTCPFNNGHRLREENLEDHLEKCQWKAEGYTDHDLPLSEPCPSINPSSSIKFDEQLQDTVLLRARDENPTMRTEIYQCCPWNVLNISFFISFYIAPAADLGDRLIPRTSDRLVASFTSDERKAIYDYVIANTIQPDIGDDIADMNRSTLNDRDHPRTSLLELLAQERNLKRRRAKHRGVHTNKKSQVEILREVINQQMEMYSEYLGDSSAKYESRSPSRTETSSLVFQPLVGRKNYQQTGAEKYGSEQPKKSSSRSENRHFNRASNFQTPLPARRSPANNFSSERDRKRNRSKSRESGRKSSKHSKHERDRSKERTRHEEKSGRYRLREEESWSRDEFNQSKDNSDRRKRHRSREKSNKYQEKSRRREKSTDHYYYRDQRKLEADKSQKRNH